MNKVTYTIRSSRQLAGDIFEVILEGDTSAITMPGQFVNLDLPGFFLRRPISICDWDESTVKLLVKIAGKGTDMLVHLKSGVELDTLSGLGNGFDFTLAGEHPILVGGGIGIAPIYGLARRMKAAGITPLVALGFRSAKDAFYLEEFKALGCELLVATEDGSMGMKGFVTDLVKSRPERDYILTCGPLPMLKALHALPQLTDGQFSFEARMGCGFGACVGCTVPTKDGYKRVCKDGPILYKEEIVW